jgi:uncharacterized protein YwgA
MDRQQISLKLTLNALDFPLRLETFGERMALQKVIYLCQVAGIHLGYRYNWYLRGPYSPDLTRDAFDLNAKQQLESDEIVGWNLDEQSILRLKRLRPLWASKTADDRPGWLELLASVLFLKRSYDGRSKDAAGLKQILERNEKYFSEDEIRRAIEELDRNGLLPTAQFRYGSPGLPDPRLAGRRCPAW